MHIFCFNADNKVRKEPLRKQFLSVYCLTRSNISRLYWSAPSWPKSTHNYFGNVLIYSLPKQRWLTPDYLPFYRITPKYKVGFKSVSPHENMSLCAWCAMLSVSSTPHTVWPKAFNAGLFCLFVFFNLNVWSLTDEKWIC